jgi:hypothetical protein
MMMYDIHMHLNYFNIITNDGLGYITTFNINTKKKLYIVCVYKIHSCSFFFPKRASNYNSTFFKHCLIIIMGDFYVDILKDNNHEKINKIY